MADHFDAIVIGAGVMGSAAAYHLSKQGRRALLLEQFEIGHSRASSHGESRIFRFAYDNPEYAKLAMQCKPMWRVLEQEAGEALLEVLQVEVAVDVVRAIHAKEFVWECLSVGHRCFLDRMNKMEDEELNENLYSIHSVYSVHVGYLFL